MQTCREALREMASGEKNARKNQTWLKAKLEGEQMCSHLEMTDSPFLCHRKKDFVAFISSNSPQARQAMHMPSGLTSESWFGAAVCKVEKNLRKTKVYEWLNSPVAC